MAYGFLIQRLERNDFVQAVQKFGGKLLVKGFPDDFVGQLATIFDIGRTKSYTASEITDLACANIRGDDNNCVLKVHSIAVGVGKAAFVHHLQQNVEHIFVGFLNFIEQDDGIRATAHAFRELASFIIAYVSRRCANQTAGAVLLHVFTHVNANQGVA